MLNFSLASVFALIPHSVQISMDKGEGHFDGCVGLILKHGFGTKKRDRSIFVCLKGGGIYFGIKTELKTSK